MVLHNIYFTETELEAQLKTTIDFLSQVHPELNSKGYQSTCVELRPINRSGEFNISLNRSLNLWRLDDKSIDLLRDFLYKHNGQPYCLYYSVFAYDYQKESYTKTGKKAIKGKITSDSALYTNEIVLDFDAVSYVGFEQIVQDLNKIGIEGLWVFTGHGYQLHILLDNPLYDSRNLYKLVYLFRAKGFMCDPTCVDAARLMRLPFTYNCKCFANEEYDEEFNSPPLCKIIKESNKRFSLEEIIDKLLSLPTVNLKDEEYYNKKLASEPEVKEELREDVSEDVSEEVSLGMIEYPEFLDFDDLPEAIVKMLKCTPMGFRNNALGLLIKYFKNYLMFGKDQIFSILKVWAESACDPAYNPLDFHKDFERLYQGGGLNYSAELAKQFGYIDFENQIQLHRDNKVFISNSLFQNIKDIDGNVLRVYLAVKILEHGNSENDTENEIKITIDALADVTGMSIRNLKRVLQTAKSMKLLYVKQGVKRKGEPNTYHCNQIRDLDVGFKALSVNDLEVYLSTSKRLKLSNNELKLYLFMLYKFYTKDRAMSLKKMGEFIGCAESTVSELVSSLRKKRYLRVEKIYRDVVYGDRVYKDKVVFYNKYTLLK